MEISKDLLNKLYILENKSRNEICKILNTSPSTIKRNLKKYNITKSKELVTKLRIKTCIEKYNVDNPAKLSEVKEKTKLTNLQKYNKINHSQTFLCKEKRKHTCLLRYNGQGNESKIIKAKYNSTMNALYGVDCNWKSKDTKLRGGLNTKVALDKQYRTKKKNKSFNTSKAEAYIYELLENKFKIVYREYKSEEYPFYCDFYIKDLDLYIEYNGHPTHGKESFDLTNSKHQEILNIWKEKATKSKYYKTMIRIWTIVDPKKQDFAIKNNLNYLKFYNLNEFMEWYNKLS